MASNAFNLSNVALTSSSSSNATIVTFTGNLLAQSLEVQGSYVPPNGIYLPAANTIGFTTASIQRMRITALGNVGIGTATVGTGNTVAVFGGNIYVGSTNSGIVFADGTYQSTAYGTSASGVTSFAAGTTGITPTAATAGAVTLAFGTSATAQGIYSPTANQIALSTASTARLLINATGNILLGTTAEPLGGNATVVVGGVGTNGGGIELVGGAAGGIALAGLNGGGMRIDTYTGSVGLEAYTERMRITSAGLVGIGSTPDKLFKVYRNSTDQDAQVQIEQAGSGSPTLGFLKTGVFAWLTGLYNSDNSYRIAASGTDLNTSTALTISSTGAIKFSNLYGVTVTTPRNVFVDASGNIGGISSIRASKTNIASMSDANWVLDLNPVTFNYRKKDKEGNFTDEFDTEKMYGLIAEDAATVNPDICIYNEVDGEQKLASIHYDRLIAPIIKVLKDQQAMIEALQAQVTELQRR